ncbi:MAG: type IV toxin-antitoxin system AbiEi family antitoxin domain-containing protein, partial [Ilumatobacteraceae bacterium]
MRTSLGTGIREVDGIIARQSGIVALEQLTDHGVSLRTLRRLVGAGILVVVFPGVFRSATWPLGRHQLMTAGCL